MTDSISPKASALCCIPHELVKAFGAGCIGDLRAIRLCTSRELLEATLEIGVLLPGDESQKPGFYFSVTSLRAWGQVVG